MIEMQTERITLFLPSLRGGGAENVLVRIANYLATHMDYRIDLVVATAEGPLRKKLQPEVRLIDLGRRRVVHTVIPLSFYLRRERPNVLLSTMTHTNVVAAAAIYLSGRRCMRFVVREANYFSKLRHHARRFNEKMSLVLARWVYERVDKLIAPSADMAGDLQETLGLPKGKVAVIYNPVEVEQIHSLANEEVRHPWLNNKNSTPVILSVGRLEAQKGFDILLQAVAEVRKNRAVRLIILGEGKQRPALLRLCDELGIADSVEMPGFVDNPYPYMRQASLYVLSSNYEGMPNVLIEALALGTPIVSTDCPSGPREVLRNGDFGLLVPVGDPRAMAAAILTVLDAPERYGMTPEREAWVRQNFALEQVVQKYLHVMGYDGRA